MAYQSKPLYFLNPLFPTPELTEAEALFLPSWLEKHQPADNTRLFHYTTLVGLQGILKNRSLWCGHVSSFNDPLEIQYGKEIVSNLLNVSMEKEKQDNVRAFLRSLLVDVQAFGEYLLHTFAVCFCESGELLSQWRSYANRGGGYCLGFQFSSNTKISSNLDGPNDRKFPFLRRVIYDEVEQRQLVQNYVDSIVDASKKALEKKTYVDPYHHASVMAMQAANRLLDMLICFKHNAFKEEREWRLVHVTREDFQPETLQFRETCGCLVPYRPTYIFDENEKGKLQFPLCSIAFGPTLDPVRTRSSIELLLRHIAVDGHPIELVPPQVQIKGSGYSIR